jgi:hypothetical protein
MVKFWILTIGIFSIITFFLNKAIYKYFRGEVKKDRRLWNIYYWEGLVALSSGLTFVLLFILKSVNLLSF